MFWKKVKLLAIAATVALPGIHLSPSSAQPTTTSAVSQSGQQNRLIRTITEASESVSAIAVSPDGKILAGAGRDKTIKLWNFETGQLMRTLVGHSSPVLSIAISPNGQILASGSEDKTIKLWDVNTGKLIRTLSGHSGAVNVVAISPDGAGTPSPPLLVSGSADTTIKLWNLNTGELIRTLRGHTNSVVSIAVSPDGRAGTPSPPLLASGSEDETLRVWNLKSGKLLQTYTDNPSPKPDYFRYAVNSVAISPDGQLVASASIDDVAAGHIEGNTIRIRNLKTGQLVSTIAAGSHNPVNTIAFSPNGQTIIASLGDVRLWNLQTGELLRTLTIDSPAVALSRDGQTLFSAGDRSVTLWGVPALISASSGQKEPGLIRTIDAHSQNWGVDKVAFISIPDRASYTSAPQTLDTIPHSPSPGVLDPNENRYNPVGKTLVTCSGDGKVKVWDSWRGSTQALVYTFDTQLSECVLAISPDGQTLAVGNRGDGFQTVIKLIDLNKRQVKSTLSGHDERIGEIAISPDGQTFVSSSQDGTIKVWNLSTGELRYTLSQGMRGYRLAIAISPNGKTLIGVNPHDNLKIWDLQTGKLMRNLSIKASDIISITSDGQSLIGKDLEGKIHVWSLTTGELVRTVPINGVKTTTLSHDGQVLATDSNSGTIQLWDIQTGRLLQTFSGHSSIIKALAFSADDRILASGDDRGMLKIWSIPTSVVAR